MEETVEIEGKIEEAVAVAEEGLVVEAATGDVDVDHLLIVQCPEADLVPKVLQGGDAEAEVIEVGMEETVEIEGKIEEAVVVAEEGLVVEAATGDVDVDHLLIVQCPEADL